MIALVRGLFENEYDEEGFRTCSVTNLNVHRSVEVYVKLYGLTAVIALVLGGVFAFTVAMTRWEVLGLLSAEQYYIHLSLHAFNILIFWMIFMEIAILYVGGPMVLGRRLPYPSLAKAGWVTMVVGAVIVNLAIWTTSAPDEAPALTAYVPASPWFHGGAIVFILGTTIAALPFFVSIWREKRWGNRGSLPLVTFGAFVAAIIAVETLLGGLLAFGYNFAWRVGWIGSFDHSLYRMLFWIVGHGSQQINLVAMVTVWYFITHVVAGAVVVSEKVSRTAFIMYLFFINIGAAHHLMVDPVFSTSFKLWNTSYAIYAAAAASMIHAFAIPAGLEVGRRRRGLGGGFLGWLTTAPWRNPAFSATVLSVVLFGFLGGITGVVMGQMQINLAWHNTWGTVGHFHGTVAAGTTLAFMGLVFFVIKTMFRRDFVAGRVSAAIPFLYGGTMGVVVILFMYMGLLYGIPRRTPEVIRNIPATEFNFIAADPLHVVWGAFALLAVLAGVLFILVAVGSLLLGGRLGPGDTAGMREENGLRPDGGPISKVDVRGTFGICLFFLVVFVGFYALNWYLITELWTVGL